MQTNAEYFATMTVPMLKARLTLMNVAGLSKLRKAELVNALVVFMDGFHADATVALETRNAVVSKIAKKAVARKSYNKRMASRINGYLTQIGHGAKLDTAEYDFYDSPMALNLLTPAQRRRVAKKSGKQYANLISNLNPLVGVASF